MRSGAPAVGAGRSQLALFILAAVVIALIMGVNVVTLDHMRRNTLLGAQTGLTGAAAVVAEQAASSLRAVDARLSELAGDIVRAGSANPEAAREWLREHAGGAPATGLMLVDADGMVVASSGIALEGARLADRDFFRTLRDSPALGSFVGAPLDGQIPLARRLTGPGGEFAGLAVGLLPLSGLADYYAAIFAGRMTRVSLKRADGALLAQYPAAPDVPDAAAADPDFDGVTRLEDRTGAGRFAAARRVPGFPVIATVSQPEAVILDNWTKMAWLLTLISTCNAGLVVVVSFVIAKRWQAQGFLLARLAESEASARRNARQLETALAYLPQGLCMFDRDMRVVVANEQYARLYDLEPGDIPAGSALAEVVERRLARGVYAQERRDDVLRGEGAPDMGGERPSDKSVLRRLTNGRVIAVARTPTPDGGWIAQHTDVTDEHQAMERINFLARHDSLTRLTNRAQLIDAMGEALDALPLEGGCVCVLLIDLDLFKAVNDRFGHGVGDRLLVEVGRRLIAATRPHDVVARLGGDEFAILLSGPSDLREGAEALAGRLVSRISEPYDIDAHPIAIGASVGIASAPEDGLDVDGLMMKADLALYKAKGAGRGGWRFYDASLEKEALNRRNLRNDLLAALAADEFELVYQPIVCARTLDIVAAEALLRWRHPREGLIGPDRFIPLAEETGAIAPLGEWILRRACAEALNWPQHVHVAVNISPVQFKRGGLVESVAAALSETGFPAGRLELEITENVFMENSEENLAVLGGLKRPASRSRWMISAPAIPRSPISAPSCSTRSRSTGVSSPKPCKAGKARRSSRPSSTLGAAWTSRRSRKGWRRRSSTSSCARRAAAIIRAFISAGRQARRTCKTSSSGRRAPQ